MLQSAGMYNTYAVSMQSDTRTNERLANGDISGACEYCTEARKRRWRKEHHKPDWKWLPILHTMDECKSLVSRLYNNDCMNACSFCFGKRLMDIKLGSTVEPITHELRFCRRMQQVYMKGGTTAGTEDGGGDDTGSGENEDSPQQSKSGIGASGPSQGPQKLTANAPAWPPHPSHNRGETELIDMMQRSSINGNNQTRRNYGEREHEEPYGRGGGRGGRERGGRDGREQHARRYEHHHPGDRGTHPHRDPDYRGSNNGSPFVHGGTVYERKGQLPAFDQLCASNVIGERVEVAMIPKCAALMDEFRLDVDYFVGALSEFLISSVPSGGFLSLSVLDRQLMPRFESFLLDKVSGNHPVKKFPEESDRQTQKSGAYLLPSEMKRLENSDLGSSHGSSSLPSPPNFKPTGSSNGPPAVPMYNTQWEPPKTSSPSTGPALVPDLWGSGSVPTSAGGPPSSTWPASASAPAPAPSTYRNEGGSSLSSSRHDSPRDYMQQPASSLLSTNSRQSSESMSVHLASLMPSAAVASVHSNKNLVVSAPDEERHREFMTMFKTVRCLDPLEHSHISCMYYHSAVDRRRDPYGDVPYDMSECLKLPFPGAGWCSDGDSCTHSHNQMEMAYHPRQFKTNMCESPEACSIGAFCCHAHNAGGLRVPTDAGGVTAKFTTDESDNKDQYVQRVDQSMSSSSSSPSPGFSDGQGQKQNAPQGKSVLGLNPKSLDEFLGRTADSTDSSSASISTSAPSIYDAKGEALMLAAQNEGKSLCPCGEAK